MGSGSGGSGAARTQLSRSVRRLLIVLQGLVTVLAAVLLWPLGGALVLINAVAFFATKRDDRRLFAVFALTGAVGFVAVLVFGFQTGVTQEVTVIRQ